MRGRHGTGPHPEDCSLFILVVVVFFSLKGRVCPILTHTKMVSSLKKLRVNSTALLAEQLSDAKQARLRIEGPLHSHGKRPIGSYDML